MCRTLLVLLASIPVFLLACAGTAPLHPNAVEHNRVGADALALGDFETAQAHFALALEYHPRFVEALTNLGLVEMQRGNLERARTLFQRACRYNTDLAQPHHALGVLEERERRPDLAAEHYREALRIHPGFGPSRANLGRMLFSAGMYDEAREQFARLLASEPGDLTGHLGVAESLMQLGREEEGDEVTARAVAHFGEIPELVVLVARREIRQGAFEEAEARLLPLTDSEDDVARAAWSFLAVARLGREDAQGALDAAEQALSLDRNDPVATYVVAMGLLESGDPRALGWLERAHLLSPKNVEIVDALRRAQSDARFANASPGSP